MANPQKENGHIEIANEIVEALMRINLSAYESRVLWFLFRKTYGWQKKVDWISLSQFSKDIGLDRRLIHRAIKGLSSKKMIVIERDDGYKIRYGFQKNYEKWNLSSKKMTVINTDDKVSSKEMIELSSKEIPTKETITKETITKEKRVSFIVPSIDEIRKYCLERKNNLDPAYFFDYQMARDWKLKGGQKIKDWQAVIRTWERNSFNSVPKTTPEYKQKSLEELIS